MSGPLFVKVDWQNNGTFTDAMDDITDRVRDVVSASYGRDQTTALSPVIAGRGGFDLDNRSKAYSPRNASSPLFGNLKPRRKVLITRVVSGVTYTVFYGHTDDAPINPDVDAKTVTLNLVDALADFRGINVTIDLYKGIRTGQAIGHVLDAAGWTGGRDLDTGATLVPWFWTVGADAFSVLQDLLASEGPPALMSIDTTGAFVFRDRHHRLVRAASTASQATLRGTDSSAEPHMAKGFTYSDSWQNVINSVSLTVEERGTTASRALPVFTSDEVINIPSSGTVSILIQTDDPFSDLIVPDEGTDYIVVAGSISFVSVANLSGGTCTLSFTANVGGATISNVQLRAWSVPVLRTYQVTSTDSASITDYGQRSLPSGMEPVWASRADAQAIADLLVLQRKQPLPILNVRFSCQATQTTRLTKTLSLDLSDRVTVIEPETAVNSDFFVETIEHNIASQYSHEIIFGLEAVPAAPTSAFILNTSLLNGAAPLGY